MAAAYLIGAIPSAYLAVSWARGQDIRSLGDGNAGAGNAAHILGARAGLLIGAVDIAKGAAAVLLARFTLGSEEGGMIAGLLAVMGHVWPIYLHGRGGRGAAPAVGVLLATLPLVAFYSVLPALAVLYWTRSPAKALAIFYIPIPFLSLGFLAVGLPSHPYPVIAYSVAVLVTIGTSHLLSQRRGVFPQ